MTLNIQQFDSPVQTLLLPASVSSRAAFLEVYARMTGVWAVDEYDVCNHLTLLATAIDRLKNPDLSFYDALEAFHSVKWRLTQVGLLPSSKAMDLVHGNHRYNLPQRYTGFNWVRETSSGEAEAPLWFDGYHQAGWMTLAHIERCIQHLPLLLEAVEVLEQDQQGERLAVQAVGHLEYISSHFPQVRAN